MKSATSYLHDVTNTELSRMRDTNRLNMGGGMIVFSMTLIL